MFSTGYTLHQGQCRLGLLFNIKHISVGREETALCGQKTRVLFPVWSMTGSPGRITAPHSPTRLRLLRETMIRGSLLSPFLQSSISPRQHSLSEGRKPVCVCVAQTTALPEDT